MISHPKTPFLYWVKVAVSGFVAMLMAKQPRLAKTAKRSGVETSTQSNYPNKMDNQRVDVRVAYLLRQIRVRGNM